MHTKTLDPLVKKVLIFLFVPILTIIAINVWGGYHLRLSGDDFTFANLAEYGAYEFFHPFFSRMAGRITNALTIFIMYQAPTFSVKLTPVLFVASTTGGTYLLIKRLLQVSRLPAFYLATTFTFSIMMLPVNQYQVYYWLPAYISYGLPLSLLLVLFAYITKHYGRPSALFTKRLVVIILSSFLIGSFHEIIAIFGGLFVMLVILLITLNDFMVRKATSIVSRVKQQHILIASLIGFIFSFLVAYMLPATGFRRSISPIVPQGKWDITKKAWEASWDMFEITLAEPVLFFGSLVTILVCLLCLKKTFIKNALKKTHPLTVHLVIISLIILPFMTILFSTIMTLYGYGTLPPQRAHYPFQFILTLCCMAIAVLLAGFYLTLSKKAIESSKFITVCLLLVVAPIVIFRYTTKSSELYGETSNHAQLFDQRASSIREKVKSGETKIVIPSLPIGDTPYPKNDITAGINKDIARYYNAKTIEAYGYTEY